MGIFQLLTVLHPGLIWGGLALLSAPIVLHLVMRQQPKYLEFPALRFIQQRQISNRRRLKLRHLLLLLLRMLAIFLLALALARPSIKFSASSSLAARFIGNQEAPVAAALVFDTSPRMDYRLDNKTRLQIASDYASWLLSQLPMESEVAILDGKRENVRFQVDIGAAKQRVEKLETRAVHQSLAESISSACELLKESKNDRKEIYIFTDLAETAWLAEAPTRWQQRFKAIEGMGFYVIDVGIDKPNNMALGELRLSSQVLARNSPLTVTTDVSTVGNGGARVVEAYLLDDKGRPEKRDQESVQIAAGESQAIEFHLGRLQPGSYQGFVRIEGTDNLEADNIRYFTVDVRTPWKILVAAPKPADEQALYLTEALMPDDYRKSGQARFEGTVVAFDKLGEQMLNDYAAVFLLDPPPMADAVWQQLSIYVQSGGGVAIFLGENARVKEFNETAPQELLPGPLASQARFPDGDVFLSTENDQHPLLTKFRPIRGAVPWESFPVFRYWQFEKLAEGVGVVVPYNNLKPALLEKPPGKQRKGRVLTLTTPISEQAAASEADLWNLLPTGFRPWPFVMLANEMGLYLVGSTDTRLNYLPGETANVPLEGTPGFTTYLLSTPRDPQRPDKISVDATRTSITVSRTEWPGNYAIRAGGDEGGVRRGFSVNLPALESRLDRIDGEQLKEIFGDVEFHLAREKTQIERQVSQGRIGSEIFPWLILILALVLCLEQVLANRFYTEK